MMPSAATDRREREKLAIRTKILDAARELFAEHGYDAVTMRTIAEKIEYTPTAIYYHFKDKDALIQEMCDEDYGALSDEFQKIATVADPVERLRAMGAAYAHFAFDHPNHYRLMFMTPVRPGESYPMDRKGKPDQDGYAFLLWTVGQAIQAGKLLPQFTDAELTAQVIWSAVHGIVALHIAKGGDPWVVWRPVEQRVDVGIDILIRGLTHG